MAVTRNLTKVRYKTSLYQTYIESHVFNTDPNNIKLRMLKEGMKYKQLEEKIQSIKYKESFKYTITKLAIG